MPEALVLPTERLDRFEQGLRSGRGRTVGDEQMWRAFAGAFPEEANRPSRRRTFLAALETLQERRILALPSRMGRLWDKSLKPAVPTRVTFLVQDAPDLVDNEWRKRLWHPALSWVPKLPRLASDQLEFLERVERGLIAREFDRVVPVCTRSLQLTGDEKRLNALQRSEVLFGPGRLDLEILGCRDEPVPMAWEQVGPGARVLILENHNPFSLARRVFSGIDGGRYRLVGWGHGRMAERSIRHLATIGVQVEAIDYVGDLDHYALEIVCAARIAAAAVGLPEPQPAPGLHRRMLERVAEYGHPEGLLSSKPTRPLREAERAWLPEDVREDISQLIAAGRRVPEEVLLAADFEEIGRTQGG